jgi:hypothetical protein
MPLLDPVGVIVMFQMTGCVAPSISPNHPLPERAVTGPVSGEMVARVNVPVVPSAVFWKLPLIEVEEFIAPCAFACPVVPPLAGVA